MIGGISNFADEEDETQLSVGQPISTAGLGEESDYTRNQYQEQLDKLGHIRSSIENAYGQNATSRWAGTAAKGLSYFNQREPIYKFNQIGRLIQQIDGSTQIGRLIQQIDGSTHMAQPAEGLIGGKALENSQRYGVVSSFTPNDVWQNQFTPQMNMPKAQRPTGGYSWEGGTSATGERTAMAGVMYTPISQSEKTHPAYAY